MNTNNAEGGSNAVTPTAADTGSGTQWSSVLVDATGILTYSSAHPAHGSMGYRYACHDGVTAARTRLVWNGTSAADQYGAFYIYWDSSSPTGGIPVCQFRINGGAVAGYLSISSGGLLQIRNGAEGTIATMTTVMSANTLYRVEYRVTVDGTANAKIQVRLYAGNSTTALEDSGQVVVVASGTMAAWDTVIHGSVNANTAYPDATNYIYLDDLTAFAGTWPGPSAVPQSKLLLGVGV